MVGERAASVPRAMRALSIGEAAEEVLSAAFVRLKRTFRAKWAEEHDRQCTRRGNCRLLVTLPKLELCKNKTWRC